MKQDDLRTTNDTNSDAILQPSRRDVHAMGVSCANRRFGRATEHFLVTGPVRGRFARPGPVEAVAKAVLGLFARPVLGDLVRAGAAGPVPAHLPWPPKLGID